MITKPVGSFVGVCEGVSVGLSVVGLLVGDCVGLITWIGLVVGVTVHQQNMCLSKRHKKRFEQRKQESC